MSDTAPTEALIDEVMSALRRHVLPFCFASGGDIPSVDLLGMWLAHGSPGREWTIDAIGARDWKLDLVREGEYLVRYRGTDPRAAEAAVACNVELASLEVSS